ncbi:MAG: hypothetical protein JNM98_06160 [Rhodocyclaceae bacterium]|nr:hypothetical protein [Rhodocyclaceae bacterium]
MSAKFPPRIHPAQSAMRAWAATQPPDIWQRVEAARVDSAAARDARYYARHAEICGVIPRRGALETWATDVALASGWSAWRMTQGIYRYDPPVYEAVRSTPIERIPVDVLDTMPEWAVVIDTPDWAPALTAGAPCPAVMLWRNTLMEGSAEVLMAVLLAGRQGEIDYDREVLVLPLAGTLDEVIARRIAEADTSARLLGTAAVTASEADALRDALPPLLNLLLYLCSQAADISGRGAPGNPAPVRTRRDGWRLFPAPGPRTWEVGTRMGAALRAAYQAREIGAEAPGATPRPHVRRAHWHGYWTGARANGPARRFDLRWLPPIGVGMALGDGGPSVIRPVK